MARSDLNIKANRRSVRWADWLTELVVRAGGYAVIATIVVLFGYLLWVTVPLFGGASIGQLERLSAPGDASRDESTAEVLLLDADDSGERLLVVRRSGQASFVSADGVPTAGARPSNRLPSQGVGPLSGAFAVAGRDHVYALLDPNGRLSFYQSQFSASFTDGQRTLRAALDQLFDEQSFDLGLDTARPWSLDVAWVGNDLLIAVVTGASTRLLRLDDVEADFEQPEPRSLTIDSASEPKAVRLGPRGRWLYLFYPDQRVELVRVGRRSLTSQGLQALVPVGHSVDSIALLSGAESLLVGDSSGVVSQWLLTRSDNDGRFSLRRVRTFDIGSRPLRIVAEQRRKGFVVLDELGRARLFHTTSERHLASAQLDLPSVAAGVFSLDATSMLLASRSGDLLRIPIDNPHPEISWYALWQEVWYEGYAAPDYVWQSTASDDAFEPKFSLTPLLFGTLKAASYALLFAVPMAVLAAIYTGFFMAPSMRRVVKPGIELMAALPTVILGFLAGLWLAPILERNLASLFTGVLIVPIGLLVVAWFFHALPQATKRRASGWYALFAVPLVVLFCWLAVELGPLLERHLFGGDTRAWLLDRWGIGYDQRNALVVGFAMGLAVMPTIFAIAEDAIHQVPGHLRSGSLALGATQWQTLTRVVLLAASPGILSAVMVGMGRAIGETMIVLMATGNTPIMDWSPFEGLRSFAANIAVEMPESDRDSSHFRLLFLTALVLFLITFAFNTLAELVRGRLRQRYGQML